MKICGDFLLLGSLNFHPNIRRARAFAEADNLPKHGQANELC